MIRLSPDRSDTISAALRKITRCAQDAEIAADTQAAREALNQVWFATHAAQMLIKDAEREATDAARAALQQRTAA